MRGQIPIRGEEIMKELKKGNQTIYNFDGVTPLNIGNPQTVGQGTITFNREVIAGMVYPPLADMPGVFSADAVSRIKTLQKECKSPTGAYTGNSKGYEYVRKQVAEFINRRD